MSNKSGFSFDVYELYADDIVSDSFLEDKAMINFKKGVLKVTSPVASSGAEICLKDSGVSLLFPHGAIPKGKAVPVTLSWLLDEDDLPPLSNSHSLISPVVKCEPEGTQFIRPAILTLPVSAVEDDEVHVAIWTKSLQTNGEHP